MLRAIFLCITSVITITHAFYVSHPVAPEDILDCGSTPAQAKEKGCRFDMFSYAWYRPQCYNEAHHDDFLSVHAHEIDWRLPDYTPITTEEVLEGIHIDLRPTSGQFHDLHCTYEWARLIRALAEKRPLDTKLSRNVHSYHCSQKLLEKDKTHRNETRDTTANMLFGRCGLTQDQMYEYGARSM
ncbi:hypothetical protein G7Y89_g14881 [Cudoniella acicularis]|uniref:Uncharacterized protein n=1 Tax=Cudoniella acicularis TaxID=354080 RepID=A0A8H4QX32_9HELO|nr:hypothetical protein G7Y89_g14881 [Cudoniella acicularis]